MVAATIQHLRYLYVLGNYRYLTISAAYGEWTRLDNLGDLFEPVVLKCQVQLGGNRCIQTIPAASIR